MTATKTLPPTNDEKEVLLRMLHTPPTPHKPLGVKPAPARKTAKKRHKP